MAKQIQIKKSGKASPAPAGDAPTINKSIAKKWFSEK